MPWSANTPANNGARAPTRCATSSASPPRARRSAWWRGSTSGAVLSRCCMRFPAYACWLSRRRSSCPRRSRCPRRARNDGAPRESRTSRIDVHEIPQQRIDFVIPALAAEDAVVADAGLHVVHLAIGAHAGAEILRGQRLADRADVVLLAFDRHQAHPLDRGGIRRPVHHREILVIEVLDDFGLFLLALCEMVGELDMLLDVALEVHRHKGSKLHEAGIDLAEGALALNRHIIDQVLFKPFQRLALGE